MKPTCLVYGATGYSGRLVVDEARSAAPEALTVIVAGRDELGLAQLVRDCPGLERRRFNLDHAEQIAEHLGGVDVVVNAAGPFESTAAPLMAGCLAAGCHYVDINGEFDVYRSLRQHAGPALQRGVSLVCGAGHSGAAADMLLAAALQSIHRSGAEHSLRRLAAVRVCLSQVATASTGSMRTTARMLRQPVLVVGEQLVTGAMGRAVRVPTLVREPVGRLERTFEFLSPPGTQAAGVAACSRRARASAASLVDTLMIESTLASLGMVAGRIESYLEMSAWQRAIYGIGAWASPLSGEAGSSRFGSVASMFADQPSAERRAQEPHAVVLEIDSDIEEPLIRWQLDTPNVYEFTAQLAVAVTTALAGPSPPVAGWTTPSAALRAAAGGDPSLALARLRGCRLWSRE